MFDKSLQQHLKLKYKTLDGLPTIYKGKHKSLLQRMLYKLYKRFVDITYIPKDIKIRLVREKQTIHPRYKTITHIIITHNKYKEVDDKYIFAQFLPDGVIEEDKIC